MSKKKKVFVVDAVEMAGGSKIATGMALSFLKDVDITVLTLCPDSWKDFSYKVCPIRVSMKSSCSHGYRYFLRHILLFLSLCKHLFLLGKPDMIIGCNHANIDLSAHIAALLWRVKIVQFAHGKIHPSRSLQYFFRQCDALFYLEPFKENIRQCVGLEGLDHRFIPYVNGLSKDRWPSETSCYDVPVVLWAASLIRWKRLDVFLDALKIMQDHDRPESHICYLQPKAIDVGFSTLPTKPLLNVILHRQPDDLDGIRSRANIFVSTSEHEPYGLSILEAMCAGLCVLLPNDGAYWTTVLQDQKTCILYHPNDAQDLADKISYLCKNKERIEEIGLAAKRFSKRYTAQKQYGHLMKRIEAIL